MAGSIPAMVASGVTLRKSVRLGPASEDCRTSGGHHAPADVADDLRIVVPAVAMKIAIHVVQPALPACRQIDRRAPVAARASQRLQVRAFIDYVHNAPEIAERFSGKMLLRFCVSSAKLPGVAQSTFSFDHESTVQPAPLVKSWRYYMPQSPVMPAPAVHSGDAFTRSRVEERKPTRP